MLAFRPWHIVDPSRDVTRQQKEQCVCRARSSFSATRVRSVGWRASACSKPKAWAMPRPTTTSILHKHNSTTTHTTDSCAIHLITHNIPSQQQQQRQPAASTRRAATTQRRIPRPRLGPQGGWLPNFLDRSWAERKLGNLGILGSQRFEAQRPALQWKRAVLLQVIR